MTYAQRWMIAVALKQPEPGVMETGAADDATPQPPVFQVTSGEVPDDVKWKWGGLGAAAGVAVGGLLGAVLSPKRSRGRS